MQRLRGTREIGQLDKLPIVQSVWLEPQVQKRIPKGQGEEQKLMGGEG